MGLGTQYLGRLPSLIQALVKAWGSQDWFSPRATKAIKVRRHFRRPSDKEEHLCSDSF